MLVYDGTMLHDAAWHARISLVLAGALRVWGVPGAVARDPDDTAGFIIAAEARRALRVRHRVTGGWTVTLRETASGARSEIERHAGLPGLLRRLREELAPEAPAGRLVLGARPLLGRGPNGS